MRIKMTLAYDGTAFHGWQRQQGVETVQETVENGLKELFGKETKTFVSGRTDEGVSARAQVVHFDCETTIPPEKICVALNYKLPETVKAQSSEMVDDEFNARYDVKKKTYRYKTYVSRTPVPYEKYKLRLEKEPDLARMRSAAEKLVGEHDFAAFCSANADTSTSVRTLYEAVVEKTPDGFDFVFTGSGFLYNMVRIMVGTLVFIGLGFLDESCIEKAFETKDRKVLGKTVAPEGLLLERIEY